MSGRIHSKKLKRVSGELQLAAVQLDIQRPPTAGQHLKRCHNKTSLIFSTDGASDQEEEAVRDHEEEEIAVTFFNTAAQDIGSTSFANIQPQPSQQTVDNIVKVSNSTNKQSSTNTACTKMPLSENVIYVNELSENVEDKKKTRSDTIKKNFNYEAKDLPKVPSRVKKAVVVHQPMSSFLSDRTLTQAAVMSSGSSVAGDEGRSQSLTDKANNAAITTATSLGLPGSARNLSSETPSPIWSLQNLGTATASSSEPPADYMRQVETISPSPTSSTQPVSGEKGRKDSTKESSARSKIGDGDTISSSSAGVPEAPPVSAATSGSDKPPFMLTFRRPKPLPRSRITSTAGSTRYSLPTTASTPNPVSQPQPPSNKSDREDTANDRNNNSAGPSDNGADPNNNKEDINNNEVWWKKSDRSLLSILERPIPDLGRNEITVLEAEVDKGADDVEWNSADTADEKKQGMELVAMAVGPPAETLTDKATSKSSSSNGSSSKSSSKSGDTESIVSDGPTNANNANAFITSEKGAIRFHLPGRIQHKTTIKVSHFPVGQDLVLNMKPDRENEEDEENEENENMPCGPSGSNNSQPFFPSPPLDPSAYGYPPCGPYPYSPYGYPPSPYYYGYPPYY